MEKKSSSERVKKRVADEVKTIRNRTVKRRKKANDLSKTRRMRLPNESDIPKKVINNSQEELPKKVVENKEIRYKDDYITKTESASIREEIEKELADIRRKKDERTEEHKKNQKWKSYLVIVAILLLLVGIIFLVCLKINTGFKVEKYNEKVELNFGTPHNLKSPKVCYGNFIDCKDIKPAIKGDYDVNSVGEYKIEYDYKHKDKHYKIEQLVIVKDLIEPEIIVNEETIKVCPSGKILNLEVSAMDNVDGDLTGDIKQELKDNKIFLSVEDLSGNVGKKEIDVKLEDKDSPIVKLNGSSEVVVIIGSTFTDEGATANDECDGELKVEASGDVDVNTIGEYTIEYSAKDTAGNIGKASRKVIVKQKPADKNDTNTSGVIYLTFDDGPSSYTSSILDTLAKYNIKATFFVTLAGSDDMIKREYDEGHTVALHTASHKYSVMYSSIDAYFEDLNKVADRVKRITGVDSKFIRFPGGTSNRVSAIPMSELVTEVTARGYQYFDWNVCVEDAGACAKSKDKETCVFNYFKNYLKPNSTNIVLLHDIKSYTAASLEQMIQYATEKKYTFKAIDSSTSPVHFNPYK